VTAPTRIAINGFGRIGRNVVRALAGRNDDVELVAVNDRGNIDTLAHLLEFDSVHRRFPMPVRASGDCLVVGSTAIRVLAQPEPERLPWGDLGIDIVIESTGRFTAREDAERHVQAGAGRVVVSAPSAGADVTICVGVNDEAFDPATHRVISNASCTTNCLAPMAKVMDDAFGLLAGMVTTVHAYTNDQSLLDLPHADLRRARAAALNIVPATTGAARAIGLVLPHLAGRLDGLALRVPVADGSITDLVCTLEAMPTRREVNEAFAQCALALPGIVEYAERPLVSSDVVGNPHSCVFSAVDTLVGRDHVKILGWYDNEWGYANRLVDLVALIGERSALATKAVSYFPT
jgi:glyceraldehyde 3-phosphate dehydrogenase